MSVFVCEREGGRERESLNVACDDIAKRIKTCVTSVGGTVTLNLCHFEFAAAAEVLPVGPIEIEHRDQMIVKTTISMVRPHLARSRTHLNPLSSK